MCWNCSHTWTNRKLASGVRAIPGQGTQVPIWLLGSSLYGAQLAAHLGLPYAFASHFAPDMLMQALQVYRSTYRPSARAGPPHAMVAVNALAAPTDEEAAWLFTSIQQRFLGMVRGVRGPLPPPVDNIDALWTPTEQRPGCSACWPSLPWAALRTVAQQLAPDHRQPRRPTN
jgi:luciferase family oxidoreductase group 1